MLAEGAFPPSPGGCSTRRETRWGRTSKSTGDSSGQAFADVARHRDGDFLVIWSSDNQDGSGEGIFAQRFGSTGERIGGEVQINTYTQGRQLIAATAAIVDGFVIVWSSRSQDGDGYGISARHHADGGPQANEFQVASRTVGGTSSSQALQPTSQATSS